MGIFDLFGKEPRTKNEREEHFNRADLSPSLSPEQKAQAPIAIFSPKSYSDVEVIIDTLKIGKNAVVHLTELKTETAVRILDMLSGAIYALGGGIYEMEKNIFMFSPKGVEII